MGTSVRTGNDLQVDVAAVIASCVAGRTNVLPRHAAAQVAQLQRARFFICNVRTHTHTHKNRNLYSVHIRTALSVLLRLWLSLYGHRALVI